MPAITPTNSTVLVTGGTGYIGAWVVKDLLEQGFAVKLAVRNASGADYFRDLLPQYKEKISHIVVSDISAPAAWDEAVQNVDGIIHLAMPIGITAVNLKEFIEPAIEGTVGILRSAHKYGKNVKRVVIASSKVTCVPMADYAKNPQPVKVTEDDWNQASVDHVEELGNAAHFLDKYSAAKVLAERAAWKFVETEKPTFDLVNILPVFVLGPWMHQFISKEKLLAGSVGYVSRYFAPNSDIKLGMNFVDSRDTAKMHTLALVTEEAGGQRILSCGGNSFVQELLDIANKISPPIPNIPKGEPGKKFPFPMDIDVSKTRKLFPGFTYRGIEESFTDMIVQMHSAGVLDGSGPSIH